MQILTCMLKKICPTLKALMTSQDIENILSQTQCGECGYEGCTPYAEAILKGETEINRCRPGGTLVVEKLAKLLDKKVIRPALPQQPLTCAEIETDKCIGCTLCIQACPTNCIIGAPKQIHSLKTEDCTGCKLCTDVCPQNCIEMVTHPDFSFVETLPQAEKEAWQEKRRDEVHDLFNKRNKVKQKELKKPSANKDEKPKLSPNQLAIILQAREKSKQKYSALKLPNPRK